MNKIPTLTDKELKKFLEVLGRYDVEMLYVQRKIMLNGKQLEFCCNYGKEIKEETKETFKKIDLKRFKK